MKKKIKYYILLSFSFALLALGFASFQTKDWPEYKEQNMLYLTVALKALPNESSSYELQRAGEHFSDLLLGWTVAPAFKLSDDVAFNGRRQEKQNLLFFIDHSDEKYTYELLEKIENKIQKYNEASGVNYLIADSEVSQKTDKISKVKYFLGAFLLSILASAFLIYLNEKAFKSRN